MCTKSFRPPKASPPRKPTQRMALGPPAMALSNGRDVRMRDHRGRVESQFSTRSTRTPRFDREKISGGKIFFVACCFFECPMHSQSIRGKPRPRVAGFVNAQSRSDDAVCFEKRLPLRDNAVHQIESRELRAIVQLNFDTQFARAVSAFSKTAASLTLPRVGRPRDGHAPSEQKCLHAVARSPQTLSHGST